MIRHLRSVVQVCVNVCSSLNHSFFLAGFGSHKMFDNLPGFMEKSAEREPGMEASNLLAATSMK